MRALTSQSCLSPIMATAEQISLVLGVLTAAVVLYRLIRSWWNGHGGQKRNARLPPGSTGWPLIGETWSYYRSMSSVNPSKFFEDRWKRHNSSIFKTHVFGDEVIFSADPQFNKYAMQNDERIFQSKFPQFLLNLAGNYAFFATHGELQRKLHGLTVNMMKPDRLRTDFFEEILSLFDFTINRWADMKEIVLQNETAQMVLNLTARQLLGLSPSKETTEIRKLFVDFVHAFVAIPNKIPGTTHAKGIQEEHDTIIKNKGDNRKLTWDNYKSMKFTQCVINEALRLGNFASGVYKENKEDIKVKDYDIPKGSLLFISFMAPHLDDKFYSKALKFDPWRWKLDQDLSNDPLFRPFGAGPRLCPGHHLARLELSIFLHMFVTRFRWDVIEDGPASYFPMPELFKGFPIRLHLRARA